MQKNFLCAADCQTEWWCWTGGCTERHSHYQRRSKSKYSIFCQWALLAPHSGELANWDIHISSDSSWCRRNCESVFTCRLDIADLIKNGFIFLKRISPHHVISRKIAANTGMDKNWIKNCYFVIVLDEYKPILSFSEHLWTRTIWSHRRWFCTCVLWRESGHWSNYHKAIIVQPVSCYLLCKHQILWKHTLTHTLDISYTVFRLQGLVCNFIEKQSAYLHFSCAFVLMTMEFQAGATPV